jgi:hypothetical protein
LPLATFHWTICIDFFTHAGKECTRRAWRARLGGTFTGFEDFKRNFVQLTDWVTADLTRGTVLLADTLGAFLRAPSNDSGLTINLPNDQHR